MNSPFQTFIEIAAQTDKKIHGMRSVVRAVDVGINIQSTLTGKVLTELMKKHGWSFLNNDEILAFNKKDKQFKIVDSEGNILEASPTAVGYTWKVVWSPEGRKIKINENC